jgi:IS30 family transposase
MKAREPVVVYFADSYSSWQKGAIENANKLIRKYIPKKANFNNFSDWKIKEIQKKINRRPREKLNFDTPKRRFFENFP